MIDANVVPEPHSVHTEVVVAVANNQTSEVISQGVKLSTGKIRAILAVEDILRAD